MSYAPPFVTIAKPGEEASRWAIKILSKSGLRAVRTFDLKEARMAHSDCPCPQHGTDACSCQMAVVLVYEAEKTPVSILVHSFQETSWFYLVDTPGQPLNQKLKTMIKESLSAPTSVLFENRT
jgi:hypothetical protein